MSEREVSRLRSWASLGHPCSWCAFGPLRSVGRGLFRLALTVSLRRLAWLACLFASCREVSVLPPGRVSARRPPSFFAGAKKEAKKAPERRSVPPHADTFDTVCSPLRRSQYPEPRSLASASALCPATRCAAQPCVCQCGYQCEGARPRFGVLRTPETVCLPFRRS